MNWRPQSEINRWPQRAINRRPQCYEDLHTTTDYACGQRHLQFCANTTDQINYYHKQQQQQHMKNKIYSNAVEDATRIYPNVINVTRHRWMIYSLIGIVVVVVVVGVFVCVSCVYLLRLVLKRQCRCSGTHDHFCTTRHRRECLVDLTVQIKIHVYHMAESRKTHLYRVKLRMIVAYSIHLVAVCTAFVANCVFWCIRASKWTVIRCQLR